MHKSVKILIFCLIIGTAVWLIRPQVAYHQFQESRRVRVEIRSLQEGISASANLSDWVIKGQAEQELDAANNCLHQAQAAYEKKHYVDADGDVKEGNDHLRKANALLIGSYSQPPNY